MSKPVVETPVADARPSIQPIVSHNVRILMAYMGVQQQAIGFVIGKTAGAVGHKLAGRAEWSLDEIALLSEYGGKAWPFARFITDPATQYPTVTSPKITPKIAALNRRPDTSPRRSGHLRVLPTL